MNIYTEDEALIELLEGRGIDAFGFGVLEALHFRMALAVSGMPASGNDNITSSS